jgi:hypothetical protein
MKQINLIYLLGAGRSGTTVIATILGNHDQITTLGEMHQFYEHIIDNKVCSCGKQLEECTFWASILKQFPDEIFKNLDEIQNLSTKLESHSSVLLYLFGLSNTTKLNSYNLYQEKIFTEIQNKVKTTYLLDSAKYIGRNLSLRKNKSINLKTIYVVRDVRGVINSFSKNVQSSRNPLSTIMYYLIINFASEIVYRFTSKKRMIKVNYENFINPSTFEIDRIAKFLNLELNELKNKIKSSEDFEIGHIIGGNRLKSNKHVKIKADNEWKTKQSRALKSIYYLLCFPFMLLNKYKF